MHKISTNSKKLFLKQDILKKDYQKALKKLTFFLSNPVPLNKQDKKQKGPGNSNQLLFR